MEPNEKIRNDRLRSILDKRIESRECCEYCPGLPGGNIEDDYPHIDCNKCDAKEQFKKSIDDLYNEIVLELCRDPLDDNAIHYIDEFLCPACIYQVNVRCDNGYWDPPDYEPMCSITNRFKYGSMEDDCITCKGQFFKQNPEEPLPDMTYNQYIGIDPIDEGNDE
jgi:hypothetical protein